LSPRGVWQALSIRRRHLSSQQKAAQQVGTNRQYVSDAKRGASSPKKPRHCMALFSSNGERVRAPEVRKCENGHLTPKKS
jgi:hypothetical protein